MYINVLSVPFRDTLSVECKVVLTDASIEFDAICLEGGQRFLVPEEARDQILDHLFAGGIVNIYIGRYKGEIIPSNFKKLYKSILF